MSRHDMFSSWYLQIPKSSILLVYSMINSDRGRIWRSLTTAEASEEMIDVVGDPKLN